jgi:hypothetical protein
LANNFEPLFQTLFFTKYLSEPWLLFREQHEGVDSDPSDQSVIQPRQRLIRAPDCQTIRDFPEYCQQVFETAGVCANGPISDTDRTKKLDDYRDYIIQLLQTYPGLSAVKVLRKLKAKVDDLAVSDRSVRRYIKALKQEISFKQTQVGSVLTFQHVGM